MTPETNVLNIPCDRCSVGWMVVTPEQRWRIAWRRRLHRGQRARSPSFATQAAAQTVCDDANQRWPNLDHWTESIESLGLHCSNAPRCRATQPLPAAMVVQRAGVPMLEGFD